MENNASKVEKAAGIKDLYKFFNGNPFWESGDFKLKPNYWQGKKSEWSMSFDGYCLKDIFQIHDPSFCAKFLQAVSGDGQEGEKITTLHSSSLASLMFFFGVSEKSPLYFPVGGKVMKFTRSEFEVKNEVSPGTGNYSNIDVALYGKDYVLLLESKFSEYLYPNSEEIKEVDYYTTIYGRLESSLKVVQVGLTRNKKGKRVLAKTGKTSVYCEGLKQMVSHYLGVRTEIEQRKADYVGKKVYLGEILFDFGDKVPGASQKLQSYSRAYSSLREGLQACADEDCGGQLQIAPITTYQEVIGMKENMNYLERMPERIREYYWYNKL